MTMLTHRAPAALWILDRVQNDDAYASRPRAPCGFWIKSRMTADQPIKFMMMRGCGWGCGGQVLQSRAL